jgi:hypothetical protein
VSTYLQMINRVLVNTGDGNDLVDTGATSISDVGHLKIAQFINDILEEIEEAAQWRVLRQRLTATIAANGVSATITSANERSRVFRVHNAHLGELVPLVFDVTTSTAQERLSEIDFAELLFRDQQNSNQVDSTTGPRYFALSPTASGMEIYVWPRSSTERTIELDMVVPQSRLDPTSSSDLGTSIKIPNLMLQHGATWWALEDRGEELGPRGEAAKARYDMMLSGAVAAENAAQGFDDLVPT